MPGELCGTQPRSGPPTKRKTKRARKPLPRGEGGASADAADGSGGEGPPAGDIHIDTLFAPGVYHDRVQG
eukprot:973461-Pleurochrysis_carterae.AAC.1